MNERIEAMLEKLQQERDELRVQMHLAKAEAKEEWEKLEARWEGMQAKLDAAGDEASEAAGPIKDAARKLLEEIRDGYRRIRERM